MRSNHGPDWYNVINYAMTQISMKSGMKIFGTRGFYVVSKQLKQIHLRNTLGTYDPYTLRKEEYKLYRVQPFSQREERKNSESKDGSFW